VSAPETLPAQLAPNDLALLQAALGELADAQALVRARQDTLAFVQAHLARSYQLAQGDGVRADGAIIRAPSKAEPGE
jgi:hypothetical protein